MDVKKLKKKFDVIESSGVLHHMDDPFLGWSNLSDCLNKGGLMKISLYSKIARQEISKNKK